MVQSVIMEEVKEKRNWEEYLILGLEAREQRDNSSWTLGDLSGEISTEYGEDTIGKFAYGIGVDRKTLMNYRTTAATFSPEMREKYRRLSFSHFACLTATAKPEAYLEKADNENMSVESLRNLIKEDYQKFNPPDMDTEEPEVLRCTECGLWRLKDVAALEVCKGHYKFINGRTTYV